jgi:hypothetical protein
LDGILRVGYIAQMSQRYATKSRRVVGDQVDQFLNFSTMTADRNRLWTQL